MGKVVVKELQGLEATHENIVKTLQFRGKMLSTFQSYIVQAMQSGSYGNCFRFFTNESNISVVNDCLQMLTAHLLVQF